MQSRKAYTETVALAILGFILITGSLSPLYVNLLGRLLPAEEIAKKSDVFRLVLGFYSGLAFLAALASFLMIRYRATTLFAVFIKESCIIRKEACILVKWFYKTTQIKAGAVWIIVISATGAAVRSYFLAQPMRYDEAFTFLNFVNRSVFHLFFYPLPNNHVFHTLLVRLSVEAFGRHPVSIRLPAFLAGILVIPLSFGLSRLLTGSSKSGFFASVMVALFPYLILFDTMARGYSLLTLLSLCLAVLGFWIPERPTISTCFIISFIIALGLLVMPSFLFPAAGFFIWYFVLFMRQGYKLNWIMVRVVIPCAVMVSGLTWIFYTPTFLVTGGFKNLYANRFVASQPVAVFFRELPAHILFTANQFTRNIPAVIIICGIFLMAAGIYFLIREKRWNAITLFPAMVIGAAFVLFSKRAIPFDRTWIYVIPLALLLVDSGFAGIVKTTRVPVKKLVFLVAAGTAVLIMNHNLIARYPETGHFPEAPVIVKALLPVIAPEDSLAVRVPADAPVLFYMWYHGVSYMMERASHDIPSRTFFIVKKDRYSLSDLTEKDAHKLLEIGNAALYADDF